MSTPHPEPYTDQPKLACLLQAALERRPPHKKRCVRVLGYKSVGIFHIYISYTFLDLETPEFIFWCSQSHILVLDHFYRKPSPTTCTHIHYQQLLFTFSKTCRFICPPLAQENPHHSETTETQKYCFPKRSLLRVIPNFFLPREAPWKQQCLHGAKGLVSLSALSTLTRHVG